MPCRAGLSKLVRRTRFAGTKGSLRHCAGPAKIPKRIGACRTYSVAGKSWILALSYEQSIRSRIAYKRGADAEIPENDPMSQGCAKIRAERADDAAAIASVIKMAYADITYSDHREHLMVDRLRQTDAFLPALSLVSLVNDKPVGHILLTRAHIRSEKALVETLALAPLSIVPEQQGRGIGRSLVEHAHRQAAMIGFTSIVLVGVPEYFRRLGYRPLRNYPIVLPFAAPDENRMIRALHTQALKGVRGLVEYAPGWLAH